MINYWKLAEDQIIIDLREAGYNIREISEKLPNRSKQATANRILVLRRKRLVL